MPNYIPQNPLLKTALQLHDAGHWVEVCDGKKPLRKDWQNTRSSRDDLIRLLKYGRRNIALVLHKSALVDVECDSPEAESAWQERFGGDLPVTPTWQSKRGKHRLFRRNFEPLETAVTKLYDIEFRGTNCKGALSVIPPCDGRSWLPGLSLDEVEPAELPEHIIEQLRAAGAKPIAEPSDSDGEVIAEGRRNETLFALGCSMRRHAADDTAIRAALAAENQRRCQPPLPASEVEGIVRSSVAYDGGSFFNSFNLISPPQLGRAAYHGLVGKLAEAVAPYTEAPAPSIIAHALAVTGMFTDRATVYAGTDQPSRINLLVVGNTSTGRKGTSFGVVDKVLRSLGAIKTEMGTRTTYDQQCVRGLSSGEGLIYAVADKTDPKTGDELPVEKRLLVIEPEFSKILAQGKREGNILSHILREAFDSGHLQTLTRNEPLRVDGAHIVVVGHITPEELRKRLTELDMANGFANRFLFIYVESETMLPDAEPIPHKLLRSLATEWGAILVAAQKITKVERDADAAELWRQIYPALRAAKPGLRGAILARAETIVIRLALIYALLDKSSVIRREHLEAAMAIWQYAIESVEKLFPDKTGDSLSDRLLEILANGPLRKGEIYTHVAKPRAEVDAAMAQLESAGRVRKSMKKPNGPGRPSEVWELLTK